MEFAFSAARWVVGKALAPVADGFLEAWAASKNLGSEVDGLMTVLQYAQAMLNNTRGREIDNPALNDLLLKLRLLAYDADDVLDELDYFRIQDELDGTYHAANEHAGGCARDLLLNARHTGRYVANKFKLSSGSPDATPGRRFLCGAWPSKVPQRRQTAQIPKLKFDRVDVSTRMTEIVKKLKPICAMVSTVLNLELIGSKGITTATMERPTTSEEITEPKLYGRETELQSVVGSITHGECFANELTVLPIVGPGGIGKTTFTQHVYQEVRSHFQVTIWICVSLDFNADRLAQEAVKKIPEVKDENKSGSDQELIEQRLKGKRFLLVLDDIWKCHEYEWEKLLAPFRKGGGTGNMVIVTTRMSDVAKMVKTGDSQIQLDHLGAEDFRAFFDACASTKHESWSDHPELIETGEEIMAKLKRNPLAAKTVGRLLRKQLTLEHWRRVLESKEWELQTSDNDIMPALKISYDYLPLNLKQCFSYCALFPEDYEFDSKELVHFWIGLDVLHLGDQSIRIEDVGKSHLIDLVNYGFFKRNKKDNGCHYYVIHDLLHELAVKVSRYDCLSIQISKVRSAHIPASVRHLSIIVDNKDVEDIITYKDCEKDLGGLDKRLQIESIRTLMLFGENVESFSKTFGNLFKKARALRAIFLPGASYIVEDMWQNFSKLVHLRYLRIKGRYHFLETDLPGTISRLYHLKILDIKDSWGCPMPSRYLSNLVSMQHFLAPGYMRLHSDILNVGNLKLLRELRFEAKKENKGFELEQLAQLLELEVLGIYNLEKVKVKEEAIAMKLIQKHRLQVLMLDWDINRSDKDPIGEENILESLMPHSNLYKLSISGHGGDTCPSWLGMNLSVKTLESLRLSSVSWKIFPPLGEMWFVGEHCKSCIPEQSFKKLKRLELEKVPKLIKWVGNGPSDLFSHLEVLVIKDCPELMELPFSHCAGYEQDVEDNMTWFPKLEKLEITDCPKLSSLPCVPWSSSTCRAKIVQAGSGIEELSFGGYSLEIKGKDTLDSAFWRVLAFHNLSKLEVLEVTRCPPLSLVHLEKLSSLRSLRMYDMGDAFFSAEGDGHAGYRFPVKDVTIGRYGGSGQRLTRLLSYFPNLLWFRMFHCEKLTGLGVVGLHKRTEALPRPPSISVNQVEEAQVGQHEQQGARAEEEITSEGVLLLPHQLQRLWIEDCPNLVLCPGLLDHDEDEGRTGGGGLQGLTSLTTLIIEKCPRFLSSYSSSSSSSCFPFPTSLEYLCLEGVEGMETLLPLSNLTSLTELRISECGDLKGEGLQSLLAQGRLTKLNVLKTPNFFTGSEPSLPREPELPSSSSKLQELDTEDVAGVLAAPICAFLSSSLTELNFSWVKEVERFTKEQEETLQLLTSLEGIRFWWCDKLQCLPAGLHKLPNLKRLNIDTCKAICSLPKECLPNSLQKLVIRGCPGIRSLPKVEYLPSSLRELDVGDSNSEELRRHCRKLIGTIPIVRA
ncbi:putative disease resistance protein RGA3 isoform X2 [Setaria italica]|uniref:putative disease resistance protein RGA3 isoform X2 n=1 Tax=Setaria italica TaxID=4555 RepID=UPI0003508EAC|nr:putative disease resistance protein RGA3 isoform X2 [Setaria italica]